MTPRRWGGDGRPASSRRIPSEKEDSWASSAAVRARMQRQRTRDTAGELAVRRILHALGLRYRVDAAPIPGMRRRADLVFRPSKVAVFIDGCFWHGCPEHSGRTPRSNTLYWTSKIAKNKQRDAETDALLVASDWLPIRAWEHEDPRIVAERVSRAVVSRRPSTGSIGTPLHPD